MDRSSQGRGPNDHRQVEVTTGFHSFSEGSVLYRAGGTLVLCTVSVDDSVPKWMSDEGCGWLTAEYQMHPRANPVRREGREGRGRAPKGRTMEIQRLVGRSLRTALDLAALGQRSITVDCDVLEADGGTRTASVSAGFIATALALHKIGAKGVVRDQVAAISVGLVNDEVLVDLDYKEDSGASVDMNVVATVDGQLAEVQATAEGVAIDRARYDAMLDAALAAIVSLGKVQSEALRAAGIDLDTLRAGAS